MIKGDCWVSLGDKTWHSRSVIYAKKKEVKNETGFDVWLTDNDYKRTSDIGICYMRFMPTKDDPECGNDGCFKFVDQPGRGTGEYFFAEYEFV